MSKPRIVGLGEVLWDVFPDGPRFGGAPANFACSAAGLTAGSAEVLMVSAVGEDDLGRQALQRLSQKQVEVAHVNVLAEPTGTVDVKLDAAGKASYSFAQDTAWDHLSWSPDLRELARVTDAVCFGTLGQRSPASREAIQNFLATMPDTALRIFDINLRPPYVDDEVVDESLQRANVLKLNDEELPYLMNRFGGTGEGAEALRHLAEKFRLHAIALTCGSEGAILIRGEEVSQRTSEPVHVIDTVGAGDAFTACLAIGLLQNQPVEQIVERATQVAAYVCGQSGATPPMPAKWAVQMSV